MKILALCADPGIPLDGVRGACVHLLEFWRALAGGGAVVDGMAPWRGRGDLPPIVPGLRLRPMRVTGTDPAPVAAELRRRAFSLEPQYAPDVVLERLSSESSIGLDAASRFGVPLVVQVSSALDEQAHRPPGSRPSRASRRAQPRLLAGADLVCCVSEGLVPYVLERGADPARVRVLPDGVNVAAFAGGMAGERARPGADGAPDPAPGSRPVRVGFVGASRTGRGLEVLLEATARVREAGVTLELEILGECALRAELEMQARRLGLVGHVRFLGPRPHADVPAFLRSLDVAVAPVAADVARSYSPHKVYEYAAAGRALIAPRAGQVKACFRHGEDAWLTLPGDVAELAQGLVVLARDPDLRERLGRAARERAESEFDWQSVARQLLEWIEELRCDLALPAARAYGRPVATPEPAFLRQAPEPAP